MAEKEKKLTNKQHNNEIFKEIKKLEDGIAGFRKMLKPVESVKNATLAECNAIERKGRSKA